jgi:hypothetical protein
MEVKTVREQSSVDGGDSWDLWVLSNHRRQQYDRHKPKAYKGGI